MVGILSIKESSAGVKRKASDYIHAKLIANTIAVHDEYGCVIVSKTHGSDS